MAARIVESLFLCTKRWELERKLAENGCRWNRAAARQRSPMSGAELVIRILCWLDLRGDPHGRLYGVAPADIERAAHWTGTPGALVSALISTGWIDDDPEGMRWHGYGSLNRLTLADRAKKRDKRGDSGTRKQGTDRGTDRGTHQGTDRGRPSPSPGIAQKQSPGQEASAPVAPKAPVASPPPEPYVAVPYVLPVADRDLAIAQRDAENERLARKGKPLRPDLRHHFGLPPLNGKVSP